MSFFNNKRTKKIRHTKFFKRRQIIYIIWISSIFVSLLKVLIWYSKNDNNVNRQEQKIDNVNDGRNTFGKDSSSSTLSSPRSTILPSSTPSSQGKQKKKEWEHGHETDRRTSLRSLRPQRVLDQYIEWHSNSSLSRLLEQQIINVMSYHDQQQQQQQEKEGPKRGRTYHVPKEEVEVQAEDGQRRFVLGYYSCPNQAGNRLHDFWNSLIVAIVTNRTLLWKYYDPMTCYKAHIGYNTNPCEITNYEFDCSQILKRSSWIPSYDEWFTILTLYHQPFFVTNSSSLSSPSSSIIPRKVLLPSLPSFDELPPRNPDYRIGSKATGGWRPTLRTVQIHGMDTIRSTWTDTDRWPYLFGKKNATLLDRTLVLQTSREWLMDGQLNYQSMKEAIGKLVYDNDIEQLYPHYIHTLRDLYFHGADFLYGMLFHHTFTYQHDDLKKYQQQEQHWRQQRQYPQEVSSVNLSSIQQSTSTSFPSSLLSSSSSQKVTTSTNDSSGPNKTVTKTIALHLRHPNGQHIGIERIDDVDRCLERVMGQLFPNSNYFFDEEDNGDGNDKDKKKSVSFHWLSSWFTNFIWKTTTMKGTTSPASSCQVNIMTDRLRARQELIHLIETKYGCQAIASGDHHDQGQEQEQKHKHSQGQQREHRGYKNHYDENDQTTTNTITNMKRSNSTQPNEGEGGNGRKGKTTTTITTTTTTTRDDHGPFSGLPFFVDLAFVSEFSKDGYIGHCGRTSSQLLQEVMVYNSFLEHHSEQKEIVKETEVLVQEENETEEEDDDAEESTRTKLSMKRMFYNLLFFFNTTSTTNDENESIFQPNIVRCCMR